MGTTLEVNWGAFRYNVYLLIGYIGAIVCAFRTLGERFAGDRS